MKISGLFIVGTDTGVGKTYITALLIRELDRLGVRVGAYKPACSGCELSGDGKPFWPDVNVLVEALSQTSFADTANLAVRVCPQRFAAPAAPPVAARLEGRRVDRQLLDDGLMNWGSACEFVLVEGIGGLFCPVTEEETIADVAAAWKLPLLIIARAGLGTINHTLLTVETAQRRGLAVAGILLNEVEPVAADDPACFNADEIARRTPVPVWGVVPHAATCWSLMNTPAEGIDLRRLLFVQQ